MSHDSTAAPEAAARKLSGRRRKEIVAVLLFQALGASVPRFAHVPLILGSDKKRLSKRHGATSVTEYQRQGYLPEAMVNYLTLLGWSAPDGRDVFDRAYAIENFSLDRVNSAPAVFDPLQRLFDHP